MLHLIRRRGAMSKAEATRATGLSANATSTIFRALEKDGLLARGDPTRGRIGQPSVPLHLNPDGRYYIGLKIGRRSFDIVVIDFTGAVRARRSASHAYPTPAGTRVFLETHIPALLRVAGLQIADISGSGIAMPTGLWEWLDDFEAAPDEMEAWREFTAQTDLKDLLPGPIIVENDGTAACRAEWAFSAQIDRPDSIYFFIGTFIGGGIVLNGSVFRGCHGNSGGFGPVRVPDEPGGTRLIDHASLTAFYKMCENAGHSYDLAIIENADARDLEPVLSQWIARASRSLAHAIVSAAAVIDFETVIVDGCFPEDVRSRLRDEVDVQLGSLDLQGIIKPQIIPGSFGGMARAVGAAAGHITSRYMVDNPLAPLG
ncbi:ROK family protein [Yoonia sp.]|uniref:ROK family transcriptional regulator n=1 Tax=Yoonia sp. TaxID=2212373 RepID=UPI00391A6547